MKYLLISLLLIFPLFGNEKFDEFRIYPRLEKANSYIAQGKNKEAQVLLEKVLEIDPSHEKALKSLVVLCMKEKQYSCVQKYSKNLKPIELGAYYRATIWFEKHNYAKALQAINSISIKQLSKVQSISLHSIALQSAIEIADKTSIEKYLSMSNSSTYDEEGIITLLITKKFYALALKEIGRLEKSGKKLDNKKLSNWAYAYQNENLFNDALYIINLISDQNKRVEKQIILYTKQGEDRKAAVAMEELYRANPTDKQKRRVIYLYKKADMRSELEKFYSSHLNKECIADDLRNILNPIKSSSKRYVILNKYYPFECLKQDEKFNLTIELVEQYVGRKESYDAIVLLDTLDNFNDLTKEQQYTLSHWYSRVEAYEKSVSVMQSLYAKSPSPKYKKQLMFLYEKAGMGQKTESMHIYNMRNGCNRESLLILLSTHKDIKKRFKRLKKYYPYSCLKASERINYTLLLSQYYFDNNNRKKAENIIDNLVISETNTLQNNLAFANKYFTIGKFDKTIKYAKRVYRKDKTNVQALKLLGYSNEKRNHPYVAIRYFDKALLINSNDKKLNLTIGSICIKQKNPKKALKYLDRYSKNNYSSNIMLLSAEQAVLIGDASRANNYMKRIKRPIKGSEYRYYMVKAKIAKINKEVDKEFHSYEKAIAYQYSKNTYKQYFFILTAKAYELYEEGKYEEAVVYLTKATKYTNNKAPLYAQLGFWHYYNENFEEAVVSFENAVSYKKTLRYNDALGYSYEKVDLNNKAMKTFKESIDIINNMDNPDLKHRYDLKRTIAQDKEYFVYLAHTTRLDDRDNRFYSNSTAIPQSGYGGFSLFRLEYRPEVLNNYIYFYFRGITAVEDKSINFEDETFQPSIGVRYKPFDDHNLSISIERMFKGGNKSRDDTMLRASWGFFDDYHLHPVETEYWHKSLFLDAAYYIEDEIYSLYSNYEHGWVKKLNYDNALMPYLSLSGSYHNDNHKRDLIKSVDVGIGLSYFFWLNEEEYKSHSVTGRFSIEFRQSLYSNIENENTIRTKFELMF